MSPLRHLLCLTFTAAACTSTTAPVESVPTAATTPVSSFLAMEAIQAGGLMQHIEVLADDQFHGRDTGSEGCRKAGTYIADQFARLGLEPGGDFNTYYQHFKAESGRELELGPTLEHLDSGETSIETLDLEARGEVDVKPLVRPTSNVIGVLPGSGPQKDEVVVLGAHYDHLGLGDSSLGGQGEIHNGADDNASGVAGIIELARACAEREGGFNRTLVFIAFSAKELGLLGSAYYVEHPLMPLENTVFMFNFDMIGRLRDRTLAFGPTSCSESFHDLAGPLEQRFGLGLELEPAEGGMSHGSSDHQSFINKRIPALTFFSGLHDDYHRPGDDVDKINAFGAEHIVRLAYAMLVTLESNPGRPDFIEVELVDPPPTSPENSVPEAG